MIESSQDIIDVLENINTLDFMEPDDSYNGPDFDWQAAGAEI